MKVKDLIRRLQVQNPNAEVITHADSGDNFTYQAISYIAVKIVETKGEGFSDPQSGPDIGKLIPAVIIA